jgi:hypothetical protein
MEAVITLTDLEVGDDLDRADMAIQATARALGATFADVVYHRGWSDYALRLGSSVCCDDAAAFVSLAREVYYQRLVNAGGATGEMGVRCA